MTPHERAIKAAEKITGWFWARTVTNATNCDLGEKHAIEQIEQVILADRQVLQSEIVRRIWIEKVEGLSGAWSALNAAIGIVQSVFAQQSQPEKSKPFSVFKPADSYFIAQAESDRRVLAEREACAKIAEEYEAEKQEQANESSREGRGLSGMSHVFEAQSGKKIKEMIRARSNQPEEKPSLTPFDLSCSTCVREAREEAEENAKTKAVPIRTLENLDAYTSYVKKVNDWQADRIVKMHEWQAQDQKTIQELNQTCYELSRQLAEQKEENERLTQKADYCILCNCDSCRVRFERECPADRKA